MHLTPLHCVALSILSIQLFRVVPHAARTEDTYVAMSERVEAMFPIEGQKAEQSCVGAIMRLQLRHAGYITHEAESPCSKESVFTAGGNHLGQRVHDPKSAASPF